MMIMNREKKEKLRAAKKRMRQNVEQQDERQREIKNREPGAIFPAIKFNYAPEDDGKTYHEVNTVPYEVKGGVPTKATFGNVIGDIVPWMIWFYHRNVGPEKIGRMLCLKKTFGKYCPACEELDEMFKNDVDEKERGKLYTSRRIALNVYVSTNDEEKEKGVRQWDLSAKYWEEEIHDKSFSPKTPRFEHEGDDAPIAYWDFDKEGRKISFKQMSRKSEMAKLKDVSLEMRDFSVEEFIDDAVCFESLITNAFPKKKDGSIDWEATENMFCAYYNGDSYRSETGSENENTEEEQMPCDEKKTDSDSGENEKDEKKQLNELKKMNFSDMDKEELIDLMGKYPVLSGKILDGLDNMDRDDLEIEIDDIVNP
jgi:hypothetical protein